MLDPTTEPSNAFSVSVTPQMGKPRFAIGEYKRRVKLEDRAAESKRIRSVHVDRIPVIVEYQERYDAMFNGLDKQKYLVPVSLTLGQFMYVLRKRIKLRPAEAMFVFVDNGTMLGATSQHLGYIYDHYKDPEDNFLYIHLSSEATFGASALALVKDRMG